MDEQICLRAKGEWSQETGGLVTGMCYSTLFIEGPARAFDSQKAFENCVSNG